MSVTLSEQDQHTLRIAAWGAVSLMSAAGAAGSAHQVATAGSLALTSATGTIGHVLAKAPKGVTWGKSVADLADQVLPALTTSMRLLPVPAQADDFRRTVLVALDAATHHDQGNPTMTEMARKITEALDAGQDRPHLRQILQDMVEAGFVGVTLRVRDSRGDWAGSAGTAERDGTTPAPIDGHVRIGSNTKTFIATVVLQLVAEGRLGLDAPVAGYLPHFDLDPRITVRMLLQHTSGIFNFTGEYYEDGTFVPGIPASQAGKDWVDNRFHTYPPEELVRLALAKPARFEPGTDWSYANTNYVLARLLIERVTGRPVAEELQRLIIGPLGLTGTHQPTTETDLPAPHTHAYYRVDDTVIDVTRQNPSWISSGGDMISTSRDLQTFITALVTGRLLPAELLAEMFTPEAKAGYGLGVFVQNGGTLISHNGGNAGHAALMLSTADGATTLTATLAYVDDAAMSMAAAFQQASKHLLAEVFGPAE